MNPTPPCQAVSERSRVLPRHYAGYVFVTGLFLSQVIFLEQAPVLRDLLRYFHPLWSNLRLAWSGDASFLWLRDVDNGLPLVARYSSTVFYPATWLLAVLPAPAAMRVALAAHLLLAMVSAFHLSLRFTRSSTAAWIAGLGYGLSGYLLSVTGMGFYFFSGALLPLSIVSILRLLERPTCGRLAALAAVFALQIFVADPQTLYFQALAVTPALVVFAGGGIRGVGRNAALVGGAGALALALGACQLLPVHEFAWHSVRAGGYPVAETLPWSLHPLRLLELLAPHVFGGQADAIFWPTSLLDGTNPAPWALSIHLCMPIVAVGLPVAACLEPHARRGRTLWAAISVVFVLLAFGRWFPPAGALRAVLPGASWFRFPEKFFLFTSVGLCVLGGMGLGAFLSDGDDRTALGARRIASVAVAILSATLFAVWLALTIGGADLFARLLDAFAGGADSVRTSEATRGAILRAVLVGASLFALVILRPRLRPAVSASLLVAIAAVDLLTAGWPLLDTIPARVLDRVPALCRLLPDEVPGLHPTVFMNDAAATLRARDQDLETSHRLAIETLVPNFGSPLCASYVTGYEAGRLKQYVRLEKALARRMAAALDILGVRYIVDRPGRWDPARYPVVGIDADLDLAVHRNDGLPYAHAVGRAVPAADWKTALDTVSAAGFDYRHAAVLEGAGMNVDDRSPEARRSLSVTAFRNGDVSLAADYEVAGFAVIRESFYPGWRAELDGTQVQIYRADGGFIGFEVPAGLHAARLVFDPPVQRTANRISVTALFAVLCLVIAGVAVARIRRS